MMFDVTLWNCRNFSEAKLSIEPNKLNIKFAPNGTGKSSVAAGIRYAITGEQKLGESIVPFNSRARGEESPFESEGLDAFKSVEVFDETFVNSVVYLPDGLFASSFDVFVKTEDYEKTVHRIEQLMSDIENCLDSEEIKQLKNALEVFVTSVCGNSGLTKKSLLRATSPAKKGLSKGNPKVRIPERYSMFAKYINSDRLAKWSKWHEAGSAMLEPNDDICPFCGQSIIQSKPVITGIDGIYNHKEVDNLDKVGAGILIAKDYLCDASFNGLERVLQTDTALTSDQELYISEVASQAERIVGNLNEARDLVSFFHLAQAGNDLSSKISNCTIDLKLLYHFNCETVRKVIAEYNGALDKTLSEARQLLGVINAGKQKLAQSIAGYESEINSFLNDAGYPYSVVIEATESDKCSVKLIHSSSYQVPNAFDALSYGERNALALVFFMYTVLSDNPDLVILDDPITSFDGHKRFAILHMLFFKDGKSPNSLKDRTVILLTHDYGVVFDVEHTLKSAFQPLAQTTLLHNSRGVIDEKVIRKNDLKPVRELYKDLAATSKSSLVRIAYARKLLELDDKKDLAWHLLSSLLHHKATPSFKDDKPLSAEQIEAGELEVNEIINQELNYSEMIREISNLRSMHDEFRKCICNYEKLQVARVALDGNGVDRVTKKILDETLHVDNGFIFQLDPREFETVPDSIIAQCEQIISAAESKQQEAGEAKG